MLRHTAHDCEYKVRIAFFFGFSHADIAECASFCCISDTAGIENDDVGILVFGAIDVPHFFENTCDFLAFVYVHLATVGVDFVEFSHLCPYIAAPSAE